MSEKKWQQSSLCHLESELTRMERPISHTIVGYLLKKLDCSIKTNVKQLAGATHPDRNQQVEYFGTQKLPTKQLDYRYSA